MIPMQTPMLPPIRLRLQDHARGVVQHDHIMMVLSFRPTRASLLHHDC